MMIRFAYRTSIALYGSAIVWLHGIWLLLLVVGVAAASLFGLIEAWEIKAFPGYKGEVDE